MTRIESEERGPVIFLTGVIVWSTEGIDMIGSDLLKARLWLFNRILLKLLNPIAVFKEGRWQKVLDDCECTRDLACASELLGVGLGVALRV